MRACANNSRPCCSGCGGRGMTPWPPWRFGFVPLWGIAMFLVYVLSRC